MDILTCLIQASAMIKLRNFAKKKVRIIDNDIYSIEESTGCYLNMIKYEGNLKIVVAQ